MLHGIVQWFNEDKGDGEILTQDGDSITVFFTAIQGSGFKKLEKDQKVEFQVAQGFRGPQAVNVKVIDE